MFDKQIVTLNNALRKLLKAEYKPENILLLLPHCLQYGECPQNIVQDNANCKHCGKCQIGDLIELAETTGVQCHIASGGRQALSYVKDDTVKVVVAVACEKELSAGILASLPKPVIAVPNLQPNGFCNQTAVQLENVERALDRILEKTS